MSHNSISIVSLGNTRKDYPFFMNWLYLTSPGIHYLRTALELNGIKTVLIDKVDKNLTTDEIIQILQNINPEIILFNQFYSTREEIKQICISFPKNAIRGIGGHDATFHSMTLSENEFSQQYSHADFVWQGEIENGFASFIRNFQKKDSPVCVNNINNRVQDLNDLPVLKHDNYTSELAFLVTSRGCMSGGCDFCTTPNFYHDGWRSRSVAHVSHELRNIKASGRFHINITDDNFLGLGEKDLMRGVDIIRRCGEEGLKLFIMTSVEQIVKADRLGLLKEFKGTVIKVFLGVENFNPSALRKLGKKVDIENHTYNSLSALNELYDNGISPHLGYINFNPETSCDEIEHSAHFLHQHNHEASLFNYFYTKMGIFEGTKHHERYTGRKDCIDFHGGNYSYEFHDRNTAAVFALLTMVLDHARLIDFLHFEATHLLYMNQLAETSAGKKYIELKKRSSEQNYEFFINALEISRKRGSLNVILDLIDDYKRKTRRMIPDYKKLIQQIVGISTHILREPLAYMDKIDTGESWQ
ncbi:MAG: hypothetical protein JXA07_12625 [Spirochaetes bacterium]|nr:hypothetical protein [Spirochaetota bacterium]